MCGLGYTVAGSPLNTFWATDLLHRVLHVPEISEGIVDHYAEDYADALRQAKEEPEKSGRDSDVLQLFAVDAWAYDIAAPGVGCTGEMVVEEAESDKPSSTSSAAASATSAADSVSPSFMICQSDAILSMLTRIPSGLPHPRRRLRPLLNSIIRRTNITSRDRVGHQR
jgi:hypothetical protein